MLENSVYVVNDYDDSYGNMYFAKGWNVTNNFNDASLIQFTGGEDVSPFFYGQNTHKTTQHSPARDMKEKVMYAAAVQNEKSIVGICRGGQFLNVMCGGDMWQDVDGHLGAHEAKDLESGANIKVTSTHHQMMIPNMKVEHEILMIANRSNKRIRMSQIVENDKYNISYFGYHEDTEAVFYPENKVLCFQPHPEFMNQDDLSDLFFGYIDKYLTKEIICAD